ncbi:MAG TPA: hypothetical protein VHT97_04085 [Acidimicrobiales bacterium]|nr:hypothetical protein [Acidimicrobiales bacterium]
MTVSVDRPRLSRREDAITVACTSWLILGLFVDGWAHNHQKPESFFTPWHALLYSGFLATATWLWSRYERHRGVPVGYGLGYVGAATFAIGGLADMVWHLIFGIEVNLEALLSPSHLVLFTGGLLILSSPFRAAWSDASQTSPPLARFLPALLSITLVTATCRSSSWSSRRSSPMRRRAGRTGPSTSGSGSTTSISSARSSSCRASRRS